LGDWRLDHTTEEGPALDESPVLVAIMNNQRDFDIARREGWYRIPVNRSLRRLGADYLAFYQVKAFGAEGWAINYYAPIYRVHLVQRLELLPEEREHPRATDWYYKLEIGPLRRLPHPIPSRRLRRITFIPTTLARLLSAREINDLWLGSEEEERLWEAFKEHEIEVERRVPLREGNEAYLVNFAAYCTQGKVAILCEDSDPLREGSALHERPTADYEIAAAGWRTLHFTSHQIERALGNCLSAIREAIAQEGGLARELEWSSMWGQDIVIAEDW